MQIKLFSSADRSYLEREINKWLADNGIKDIKHVMQTEEDKRITISVWW
jgi:hypothetical protein